MLGQSVGEAPDASKLLAAPPPVEAPSRAASIYTHTGGGAPQAPPRPADGAFLSRRLVTAAGGPPPPLPPRFAVARRQPRVEATVPPGCPEPWRRAAPADLGKRAMSAPCRLCLAVSLGDASTDLLKVWDPCTEVQREQNSILTP